MTPPVVLAVGSNPKNLDLLERYLGRAGFSTEKVSDLDRVDALLDDEAAVHLALVDVSGYGPAVWERCRRLHEKGVPHLVLSPAAAKEIRARGMSGGASAVLEKPVAIRRLIGLVGDLLEAKGR